MQGTSSDSIPPRQVVRMGAARKAIGVSTSRKSTVGSCTSIGAPRRSIRPGRVGQVRYSRRMDFNNLRRRRDRDRPDCWHIYCDNIHAGTIALAGRPNGATEWRWSAGFYPGSRPDKACLPVRVKGRPSGAADLGLFIPQQRTSGDCASTSEMCQQKKSAS